MPIQRCVVVRLSLTCLLTLASSSLIRADSASERRNARVHAFLLDSMRAGGIDAWIILTREGNFDPLSEDFGFHIGRGALVFWNRGGDRDNDCVERWALVSSLDVVPLRDTGIYDRVETFERTDSFEEKLAELLAELDAERIGINRSKTSGIADGLSASFYDTLTEALGDKADRMVSAETTVLSFRSKKLPSEIELYRKAVRDTDAVLREALTGTFVRPGETTQRELRDHVQGLAAARGYPALAWERDSCPGVYSGLFRDLSHAAPKDVVIEPGDILWVDFGVRFEGLTTDMIRAAYVLRPGETEAPPEVARMFATLRRANEGAVAAMKPGVFGWQVDQVARDIVTEAGFPEFFHSTGHPVGREVHGAGPSLGPRGPRYGAGVALPLEAGQIFAVEPSVMRRAPELGGSFIINMEEEVLVTKEGAEYMAEHQTELILIGPP
jgi:Xaa-Pro aminopeptidase